MQVFAPDAPIVTALILGRGQLDALRFQVLRNLNGARLREIGAAPAPVEHLERLPGQTGDDVLLVVVKPLAVGLTEPFYNYRIGTLVHSSRELGVFTRMDTLYLSNDLTGSSDEVMTGYNCPYEGTTVSAMSFITRMIFLDEATYPVFVPQNEGMLAPVNVVAPKGSIFNPNYPRACFARFCQVQRAVDLVLRGLAPVVPNQITAGNSADLHFISYSGYVADEGEYWVYLEVDEGSYGGRPDRDAMDSVDNLMANTRNNPIEELEWRFPMRTDRYELRDEPAAAGKWRGGIGVVRVNTFLTDTIVTCEGSTSKPRARNCPAGSIPGRIGIPTSDGCPCCRAARRCWRRSGRRRPPAGRSARSCGRSVPTALPRSKAVCDTVPTLSRSW